MKSAENIFIIAEAGVNHNGSLKTAKRLVDIAVRAGCDAVKFQTFSSEKLVTASAPKAAYQKLASGGKESQAEMLKTLELSTREFNELKKYCDRNGIMFISTPFDEDSADMLEGIGVSVFKISSGDITNEPLVRHIARKRRELILSTGMSTLGEVGAAVGWITGEGLGKEKITLLHCVSAYPARPEEMNLRSIRTLAEKFHVPAGLSDHTLGIEISVAAAAMGAKVIEKHFTINRGMRGPDHKASLEPEELKALVASIRNVEKAIGSRFKRPVYSEYAMKKIARKSIVANRYIGAGEVIGRSDIAYKRPGTGLAPFAVNRVIGRSARKAIKKDSFIKLSDLATTRKK